MPGIADRLKAASAAVRAHVEKLRGPVEKLTYIETHPVQVGSNLSSQFGSSVGEKLKDQVPEPVRKAGGDAVHAYATWVGSRDREKQQDAEIVANDAQLTAAKKALEDSKSKESK